MSTDPQTLHRAELVACTMLGQDPTPRAIAQALADAGLLQQAAGTVWLAEYDTIPLGTYLTEHGARAHCEDAVRSEHPANTTLSFDWVRYESDDTGEPWELYVTVAGVESVSGYVVTPLTAHAEYDPERGE